MNNTIFCDIDGTIFKHHGTLDRMASEPVEVLENSKRYLERHMDKGDHIVLTTARPESMRDITIQQLTEAGIKYHQLVMGITNGYRLLFNDDKPGQRGTCGAITFPRDKGINID